MGKKRKPLGDFLLCIDAFTGWGLGAAGLLGRHVGIGGILLYMGCTGGYSSMVILARYSPRSRDIKNAAHAAGQEAMPATGLAIRRTGRPGR